MEKSDMQFNQTNQNVGDVNNHGVADYFKDWTCIFPGKMGLSWKTAVHDQVYTKAEAEAQAEKNANVVAVPMWLWEHLKAVQMKAMWAEMGFNELRCVADVLWKRYEERTGELTEGGDTLK